MKAFFKTFSDSAKEFSKLKSIVTAALLVALHTVFACFLSIVVTDSLRISISFLVNVVIGCLFGPVMGMVCGGIGDIIQYVFKPTGPYFIGWTINAACAGLIYGMFFYHKTPKSYITGRSKSGKCFDAIKSAESTELEQGLKGMTIATYILPFVSVILCFLVPFITVIDKQSGEVVSQGNVFETIFHMIQGGGIHNATIVAGITMVLSIFLIIINIWKLHAVPLIATVLCCFTNILSVYTDKKTTTPMWGFWLIFLLLILYAVFQIVILARRHAVDLSFLIRCIIALTLDTILVNVFLGTYWVSVMYGKGFAFYLTTRLIKNLIQLPINITLTYYVLGFIRNIQKQLN